MEGEVINKRIKATESTTLAKLSILDQLKLLVSRFSNDDVAELKAQQSLSATALTMQASLERLFNTAVEKLDNGEHKSVTLSVSSKYIPYLDDVIDVKHGMGRYYTFHVIKKDLPVSVDYMFTVKIERKVS